MQLGLLGQRAIQEIKGTLVLLDMLEVLDLLVVLVLVLLVVLVLVVVPVYRHKQVIVENS